MSIQPEQLSLQESVLATSMIMHVGDAATRYTLDGADRIHQLEDLSAQQFSILAEDYAHDPKESLGWARETLIAIGKDDKLRPDQKQRRMNRYLDAYCSLTIRLDHEAFPPTKPGEVRVGVAEYIPDGFNDLGSESNLNVSARQREMIHVDKRNIFDRYKPVLREMFLRDYTGMTSENKKKTMIEKLASQVYVNMPYDYSLKNLGGGKIDLANLSEGVCRHQALTFQVLAQAAGLKTGLMKTKLYHSDGRYIGRHATNSVRVSGNWFLLDVTNPDYRIAKDGTTKVWAPGVIPIDRPPKRGEVRIYEGRLAHSGIPVKYSSRDDMYWTIDEASD